MNAQLDIQSLAERYVAVWNEPDPSARRKAIAGLWAPDGAHYVRTLEARGHEALEARVTASWEKNVGTGEHTFRGRAAQRLRDVVTFDWEMVSSAGTIEAVGREFLLVNEQGRILVDYQFIVA
jgi:hypothetical protein